MIGRKAIAGLSLLSALLFCALAAQGAAAAAHTSENTTAFTCVKGGGSLDFADEHCDETVTPGTGKFGHELIPAEKTAIEITNEGTANKTTEKTVATLKSKVPGSEALIECKTVSGTGTIENGGEKLIHKVTGSLTTNFGIAGGKDCTVAKPANCTVKEPIVVEANFMGVDELNGAEKNMGVEFTSVGANFTEITFEGEKCSVKGKTFPVKGTAIATGKPAANAKETGATSVFSSEKEMQSLKLGEESATFTSTATTRMKGGGNPITLTTTT